MTVPTPLEGHIGPKHQNPLIGKAMVLQKVVHPLQDRTLDLITYYDYEPPWQKEGADERGLYFPLEVYGNWPAPRRARSGPEGPPVSSATCFASAAIGVGRPCRRTRGVLVEGPSGHESGGTDRHKQANIDDVRNREV